MSRQGARERDPAVRVKEVLERGFADFYDAFADMDTVRQRRAASPPRVSTRPRARAVHPCCASIGGRTGCALRWGVVVVRACACARVP